MYKIIPIKDYENLYSINTNGQIYSHRRGIYLKPGINGSGYKIVTLCDKNKRKNKSIHRLLAQHFLENPNSLPEVNHIDGNKLNNNLNNLEWCSCSYNMKHSYKNKISTNMGETHKLSKLTENNVLEIRKLYKNGQINQGELSKKYKVSRRVIYDVIKNNTWKHLL